MEARSGNLGIEAVEIEELRQVREEISCPKIIGASRLFDGWLADLFDRPVERAARLDTFELA